MLKQLDGCTCELFAIAYAAETFDGNSLTGAVFTVREICGHLSNILENEKQTFLKPKVQEKYPLLFYHS